MPAQQTTLPSETRSVAAARHFTTEVLRRWDAEELEFVASQAVTELVTNAVLHARTEIVVRLSLTDGGLRIEVADRSPRLPVQRRYSSQATTGRGLHVVERLCRDWGVEATADGKVVWCEVTEEPPGGFAVFDLDLDEDVVGNYAGGATGRSSTQALAA